MLLREFKKKIENTIKPFRYIYEHDTKNKLYYFTLYNFKLRSFRFLISEKSLRELEICESKLNYAHKKYREL